MVYIEGRIQTRSWDDKEGKKRYTTEVVADRVVFLGGQGPGAEGGAGGGPSSGAKKRGWGEESQTPSAADGPSGPPPSDDDIPF
jgi:single-strand DNA-binding protein